MTVIQNDFRHDAVLNNTKATFNVNKNMKTEIFYETRSTVLEKLFHDFGVAAVRKNSKAIESAAKKNNVPADLVRAVAYLETTHGLYDAIDPDPSSIRPMNIRYRLWGQLLNENY
jgi:hypothetical protein